MTHATRLAQTVPMTPYYESFPESLASDFPENMHVASDAESAHAFYRALESSDTLRLAVEQMHARVTLKDPWRSDDGIEPVASSGLDGPLRRIDEVKVDGQWKEVTLLQDAWFRGGKPWNSATMDTVNERVFKSLTAWGRIYNIDRVPTYKRGNRIHNVRWRGLYSFSKPWLSDASFLKIVRDLWAKRRSTHGVVQWPGWSLWFGLGEREVTRMLYSAHANGDLLFYAAGSVMELTLAAPGMKFFGGRQVPKVATTLWGIGDE